MVAGRALHDSLDIPAIVERSELVILAVPESELAALVSGLASTGTWQPGQLVLHTAAETPEVSAARVIRRLEELGYLARSGGDPDEELVRATLKALQNR